MKYLATLNGKKYEVEIERMGYQSFNRGNDIVPAAAPVAVAPVAAAPVAAAPVAAPKAPAAPAAPVAEGNAAVTSPMPGNIFDILVTEGESVTAGQTLLILEAMKMENEIVAQADGVVDTIKVKKGDVVATDDVLVVLK